MSNEFSRRRFLGTAAGGFAGITILPSVGLAASKGSAEFAGSTIRLGFIGMGRQAMFLLNGFLQVPGVEVVAGCDVYGRKRTRFENRVNEFYAEKKQNIEVKTYELFTDLLDRPDIDAVVIAVPDHWHALIAIAACKAGKDVYLEKSMTFTIREGQELVKTVRATNRILGIGSQQRSDPNFQFAVRMVQNGKLGKIEKVNAYVGAPPTPYNLSEESVPEDLNWDLWLGPLPDNIHFNKELNPPISLNPPENETIWGSWRWYKEMGGGFTTDWGAHMFDISQWALGMDRNGPVEAAPIGDGSEYMKYKYANGVVLTTEKFDSNGTKGVKFQGEKGWIEVSREHYLASDDLLLPAATTQDDTPYETKIPHQINFIESVRSRLDPAVPVEIGHSSCTMCTIGNIACDLGRPVHWDPIAESFGIDNEAAKMMHYNYREPWKL